jgi:hypothetical protein
MTATRPAWWPLAAVMTEDELVTSIIDLAGRLGWLAHHARPARLADGRWRTAMQGRAGYPDLTLARAGRLLVVECKSATGRLRPDQQAWAAELGSAWRLWRPQDWFDGTIRADLDWRDS